MEKSNSYRTPIFDCGEIECSECARAFPDRSKAIARQEERRRKYAEIAKKQEQESRQ